ncbi:MAG: hypothetical protein ACRDPY_45740 [Streptosporangiaceae bacterium]
MADTLIQMEQCNAIATAAQAWFLDAFLSAQGPGRLRHPRRPGRPRHPR